MFFFGQWLDEFHGASPYLAVENRVCHRWWKLREIYA
jgi:hypothetical protein